MSDTKLCLKSYQPSADSHSHDFHQLVLPVRGSLEIEIGQSSGEVSAQQAAVICASENHAFEGVGDNQFIVADIPLALAPAFADLPVFLTLDENINRYIHFLQGQLDSSKGSDSPLVQRQMLLLLVQLLDETHAKHRLIDKRLEVARAYLERNFANAQVLNNCASHSGLSPRHLRALFAQYYAMSPSQYLLELRMQGAWQLLSNSDLSVQMIAERCGYASLSAFSDRFHKHFSQSPLQVRRYDK